MTHRYFHVNSLLTNCSLISGRLAKLIGNGTGLTTCNRHNILTVTVTARENFEYVKGTEQVKCQNGPRLMQSRFILSETPCSWVSVAFMGDRQVHLSIKT